VEELRPYVRHEPPADDDVLVVRGGDDSLDKLRRHAERIHRAYMLDGTPLYGPPTIRGTDTNTGGRERRADAWSRLTSRPT
jgi:hypothetical protein